MLTVKDIQTIRQIVREEIAKLEAANTATSNSIPGYMTFSATNPQQATYKVFNGLSEVTEDEHNQWLSDLTKD